MTNVTVTGNDTGGNGGGIFNQGMLDATNVTISGNESADDGGGLYNASGDSDLNNVTITQNTANSDGKQGGTGGGLAQSAGSVAISNTIVGGNVTTDCSGSISSAGFNLVQTPDACFTAGVDDIPPTDPLLDPVLSDNGGTTFTHALLSGSPAIDAGNPADLGTGPPACESTDQRGVTRPRGETCDIGAYEADPLVTPALIRVIGISSGPSGTTTVEGLVPGTPDAAFTLNIYSGITCSTSITAGAPVASVNITTDQDGYFSVSFTSGITIGDFIAATLINSVGEESAASLCVVASLGNDSWPTALPLSGSEISHLQYLDTFGQSLWFKFSVEPGSQIIVTLTGLPVNYDLTVYKDIAAAYDNLTTIEDLERLSAEFAPSAFSPSAFSPFGI